MPCREISVSVLKEVKKTPKAGIRYKIATMSIKMPNGYLLLLEVM